MKQNAASVTEGLREKASQAVREAQYKHVKDQSNAHRFLGNKVDYLVARFVARLKQKVNDRRSEEYEKSNEQFLKALLKKKSYNDSYKTAAAPERPKPKRGRTARASP